MIKLKAMRILVLCFSLFAFALTPVSAVAQTTAGVELTSPQPGAALQGSVSVTGSVAPPGLTAWEVLFTYAEDVPGSNPFLLAQGDQPVRDDILTMWDTTLIPDGDYRLIVRVKLMDGRTDDLVVSGLRVRNYSPIETATSQAVQVTPLPADTATPPLPTLIPNTPTVYQPNPGSIRREEVVDSMLRGAGFAVLGLLMVGIYASLRRRGRRS